MGLCLNANARIVDIKYWSMDKEHHYKMSYLNHFYNVFSDNVKMEIIYFHKDCKKIYVIKLWFNVF